ncbi:transferase [Arthrobacter sp.]|uniref:transferase n=1 Tax=Arthrobacter sp. TaxID=1667 RepID=UPI003395AEF3
MRGWLLIGASGHARSLASIVHGRGDFVGALSDASLAGVSQVGAATNSGLAPFTRGATGVPRIFADDDDALSYALENSLFIAVAVGHNSARQRVAESILARPELSRLTGALVAASATVDPTARLGPLVQVGEHAHVGPMADVGMGTIVNTSAIVEHEARVGAVTHLAPGSVLLGAAAIGHMVFVGSGARVLPGVTVGDMTVLGAGAVVTRDLAGGATYVGVPARELTPKKGAAL